MSHSTTNEGNSDIKPRIIGVIIPPPDIRKIADKTAEYVAKNGSAFEEIVMKSESNNPKFSFLKPNDPYRAYYDQKVVEFAKGIIEPEKEEKPKTQDAPNVIPITQKKIDIKKEVKREVKAPMSDRFTVENPINLSVLDMDVIKLTAQFVAKNGQKFLIALTEREKQNPQFDFLKPTHSLFSYFTNLVDAYSKCINPSKDDIRRLQQNVTDKMSILNVAGERFEYELQQNQAKKKKEELDEEERMQMAQIDWNDFVVVETIDMFDNEDLPAPSNLNQPERVAGPEVDLSKKPQAQPTVSSQLQPSSIPANLLSQIQGPQRMNIEEESKKKEPIRKPQTKETIATNKCPICGQYIPISEFNEHLRIEMLDPRYKDIKAEVTARAQNVTMASGDDIAQNLQAFARRRPDLFGDSEDRPAPEPKPTEGPKIIWDGQSVNMTRTTASQAMVARQQVRHYEEQYRAFQEFEERERREKEAVVIDPMQQLQAAVARQQQQSQAQNKPVQAGPQLPAKKLHEREDEGQKEGGKKVKTEEASLIPEEMWLLMNPGSITINVKVPDVTIDGINLKSQNLQLQFDPKTTIGGVKDYISKSLGGISSNSIALRTVHTSFLKDENTLAYYNFLNGTVVEVGKK